MNFKNKYDYRRTAPIIEARHMIGAIVSDFDGPGELETLRNRVERLTEIVGFMAAHLPPAALLELANKYDWEEVK